MASVIVLHSVGRSYVEAENRHKYIKINQDWWIKNK